MRPNVRSFTVLNIPDEKINQGLFYGHYGTQNGRFWLFLAQKTLESLSFPQISKISASERPEVRSCTVLNIPDEKINHGLFLLPLWR